MATSGFQVNGADLTANWPDKSYLMDRYPELADTFKQAGLWLWGYNAYGQLGDNTTTKKSSPVQTISGGTNWKQVASGSGENIAVIKTDGTLWGWGMNYYGQLGRNTSGPGTNSFTPIQTISGGTNWKQVSIGYGHIGAIKTDGTLWIWGQNISGQLGNNNTVPQSSPVQTSTGGTNWKQLSLGGRQTAAIKTDGSLWLWGSGNYKSSPTQTITGTNWKQVSCGFYHMALLKTDNTLWMHGQNAYGQLGDNTTTGTAVGTTVQTISGGTDWKLVACGWYHTAAIKTNGTLWLWGQNLYGKLGDNTTVNKSSPVQTVAGGTNWKTISSGNHNTAAIKTDGSLWVTGGRNFEGQLGDNTGGAGTHKSSPVQTVAGGTNWKSVFCSNFFMAAIRDDSSDPL